MVVQLLALGRLSAEERPACQAQVLPLQIQLLIHQEVLLLRTHLGRDALRLRIAEQAQDAHCLLADLLHRAQQRRFFIQRFAGIGAEHCRGCTGCRL